ncbi:YgjP-like metallopeptidase domain-containing protein [Micromonospora narathiwatensis]|uniref:YgjP-like metallopeptidase domain-containing protein n=1 Tax=Micromonospora narathiwatensis TaxID=299146 RepID=UPI000B284634|nr:YgjP-like metallopeptidase domain-containing protein [Micromonospora narathiwatensis]
MSLTPEETNLINPIRRQREQLQAAERQSERDMVTGESHYVWGRRHRLKVIERPGRAHFEIDGERLLFTFPSARAVDRRREMLNRWTKVGAASQRCRLDYSGA